jgi:hypothetical protein
MAINPLLQGEITWIMPILLGLLLYLRFSEKYIWISRYSIAVMVGIGTAVSIRLIIYTDFINQIKATMINPFGPSVIGSPGTPFNNALFIIMVLTTIIFFTFTGGATIQTQTVVKGLARFGRYTIMVGLGAAFANLVMTRTAFLYDRFSFMLLPENQTLTIVALILVAAVTLYAHFQEMSKNQ